MLKHAAKAMTAFVCFQFDEGAGCLPDPALPLAQQLEVALAKVREHVRTILDTQATCRSLDKV